MNSGKTPTIDADDLPQPLQGQDWDGLEAGEILPDHPDGGNDLDSDLDDGELPDEDDDNPMQESDEALPDDEDEAILRRNPSKEGGRFDDV